MSPPEFTERDWLNSADPIPLLDHLFPIHGFHSTPEQPRKLRLYYAACARRGWKRLTGLQIALVEACERLADGELPGTAISELERLGEELTCADSCDAESMLKLAEILGGVPEGMAVGTKREPEPEYSRFCWLIYQSLRDVVPAPSWVHRSLHSADLVRDIFRNPFDPPAWRNEWRSADAVNIAKAMYDARSFSAMGQLADALEEKGCQEAGILLHCREEFAIHTRGCWVVDWILDKDGRRSLTS